MVLTHDDDVNVFFLLMEGEPVERMWVQSTDTTSKETKRTLMDGIHTNEIKKIAGSKPKSNGLSRRIPTR